MRRVGPVGGRQLTQVCRQDGDVAALEGCKISGSSGKVAVFPDSGRGWGARPKTLEIVVPRTSHNQLGLGCG